MDINLYTSYLVSILKAVILGNAAPAVPDGIDEGLFLEFVAFHKLDNIVYFAIGNRLSPQASAKLMSKYRQSLFISAKQQFYLDLTIEAFTKHHIDYLILKGGELSKLYPTEDMRQSADFDIYLGRENSKKAKALMVDLGFEILSYTDTDEHDEYLADRVAMCELHPVLIQGSYPWKAECNSITDRLLDTDTPYKKKMSTEDFYLYNLAHTAKHMKFAGIGIRAFLDMWLIERTYGSSMNHSVLEEALKRANLYEFDKATRKLCKYWFEDAQADSLTLEMARYVAESGWVGTSKQHKSTELAQSAGSSNSVKVTKLKKYMSLLFSPYDTMEKRYSILKKHKWLLPFCYCHKALRAIFTRHDTIKNVSENLDAGDMQSGKAILEFKTKIGL